MIYNLKKNLYHRNFVVFWLKYPLLSNPTRDYPTKIIKKRKTLTNFKLKWETVFCLLKEVQCKKLWKKSGARECISNAIGATSVGINLIKITRVHLHVILYGGCDHSMLRGYEDILHSPCLKLLNLLNFWRNTNLRGCLSIMSTTLLLHLSWQHFRLLMYPFWPWQLLNN